jgi:uncharacterized membrane protein
MIRGMTEVPRQVIIAAFKDEHGAEKALRQLQEAKKQHLIDIQNVATLSCDQTGKVTIKEPTDMGATKGAVVGGAVGALASVLFPPLGLAVAGGAAIGGITAKLHDSGFKDERLRRLGDSLQPGTSAILAVIDHTWVRELEAELAQAGAEVATEEMAADIANELKSGHAVAYTAVSAGGDVFVAKATDAPADAEGEKKPDAAPTTNTPSS